MKVFLFNKYREATNENVIRDKRLQNTLLTRVPAQ